MFLTAPESYEELKSLLSGRTREEQLVVVERIQTCNHPSLAVGNKAKLEVGGVCGKCQGIPHPHLCVQVRVPQPPAAASPGGGLGMWLTWLQAGEPACPGEEDVECAFSS